MIDPLAHARIESWRLSLLDLSTENELISSPRESANRVDLPNVDPHELAAALAGGGAFSFAVGSDSALETGRVRAPLAANELARRLMVLAREVRSASARGEHALWLGLGSLTWCDATGAPHTAPLALMPVALEGAGAAARLVSDGAPRVNDALAAKLARQDDLVLAGELAALFAAAEGFCVTRSGWRVGRGVHLATYAVAPMELWRDLEGVELEPLVARIAGGEGAAVPAATGELLAPLDADESQLAAISAAAAGATFALHGAPGTGTTQTLANLAVACAAQGQAVLVVADRLDALAAIAERLGAIGLGELVLDLAGEPAVLLAQLARVIERPFRPGAGPAPDDARLTELRVALDRYASALHRIGPFGRSVHDALGRLVELRTTPRAALAESDATGLDGGAFARRLAAVSELGAAAIPVEPVATHPWRQSVLARWAPAAGDDARAALDEAAAATDALAQAVADAAALVPGLVAKTDTQLVAAGALAELAAQSPRPGAELLTQWRRPDGVDRLAEQVALVRARGTGTVEVPRDPAAFVALAQKHRALAAEVEERFLTDQGAAIGDDFDAPALWAQVRAWSGRVAPLRFVALRGTRARIRARAIPGELATDAEMLAALEAVIAERACRAALRSATEPAARWFGALARGLAPIDPAHAFDPGALDLTAIEAAADWAARLRRAFDATTIAGGEPGRAPAWRALVGQVAQSAAPAATDLAADADLAPFARLAAAVARWQPARARLADATGIAAELLASGDDHLHALRERTAALRHALDGLQPWVAFHGARQAALASGVGPAVGAIERGDLGAAELADAWERATLLAWTDAELDDTPALAQFHGPTHHAHVAAFADLERASLALVRARALVKLAERVPRVPRGPVADLDPEIAALLGAAKAARTGAPGAVPTLRALLASIPTLLSRLAPIVLATPLAVARHLDRALRFDVIALEGAGRMTPGEALGALARGRSAVLAGDPALLGPARGDSLLAAAPTLPALRLGWYHRAEHEAVFAAAATHVYGGSVQLFPSAHAAADAGVAVRLVSHDAASPRTAANRREAEAVVAEVLARLRDPGQRVRSLAVATLSRAHAALIEELLDAARDAARADACRGADLGLPAALDAVRVGDAAALAGESREVVLLSLGTDAFEPFATELGARALAAATTRARSLLVVFAHEALAAAPPASLADAPGVRHLAALLAPPAPRGDAGPASPITDAIARALAERGWAVRHRVGAGRYLIDLAVADPSDPERFVLAIEHDGAAYVAAGGARDRDRLRAQVLGQLGWRLHRIWTLDWWTDPEREIQRAHGAIVTAIAASRQRRSAVSVPALATTVGNTVPPTSAFAISAARRRAAAGSGPVVVVGGLVAASAADATTRTPAPTTGAETSDAVAAIADATGRTAATTGAATTGAATPAASTTAVAVPGASGPVAAAAAATAASGPFFAAGSGPMSAPIKIPRGAILIGPYTAAAIPAGRRAPDDLFAPRHLAELGKVVEQVLAAEAPMHVDLLARRVGAYFGVGRVTQRVADQIHVALAGRARYGDETGIVWRMDQDPAAIPPVRVAGAVAAARREIAEVPLSELAAAARIVVERAPGIAPPELVRDAARLLGFARITERVTERVGQGVALAAHRELIHIDGSRVTPLL
ncbi:MAG TPA: DUF3320 domain-containing protein [Kofleriaceae bacterium]